MRGAQVGKTLVAMPCTDEAGTDAGACFLSILRRVDLLQLPYGVLLIGAVLIL